MDIQRKKVKLVFISVLTIVLTIGMVTMAAEKQNKRAGAVGHEFHRQTSMSWKGVLGDVLTPKPKKPPLYKNYPDAKKISLPKPGYSGLTLEQAIKNRRSVRNYSKKPITQAQLSQLLFSAQGVTAKAYGTALRTSPSAGALYPFEIYAVVNNVEDLPQGIYHYSVLDHALELVKQGNFRDKITNAGLKQEMLGEAAVTFVLSAIFDRLCCKYGQRGYRYAYIEAGHISQNIYLQSVSLGLGSVCAGAFLDDKLNKLIGIDGKYEAAIYLHAVGAL